MSTRREKVAEKVEPWIEEYRCGCSESFWLKMDMLGYCPKHGDDWIVRHNVKTGSYRRRHRG